MLVVNAWAADATKPLAKTAGRQPSYESWRRAMEIHNRARELYPRRRDTPLREANMTDDEVREVQAIAREYKMSEFVNISPVVTGCPCEDGGSCTEQVYITSTVGEEAIGLQLSRYKNSWTVGAVQKWWLEYAALLKRERTMSFQEFVEARELKLLEFPVCQQPGKSMDAARQTVENSPTK